MNTGLRLIALFFAVLLFYLSVSFGSTASFVHINLRHDTESRNSTTYFSVEKSNFLGLTRHADSLFNLVGKFQEEPFKFRPGNYLSFALSSEIKRLNGISKYLSYSSILCSSLEIKDIIYPFHYFW